MVLFIFPILSATTYSPNFGDVLPHRNNYKNNKMGIFEKEEADLIDKSNESLA